ncbi:MAG: DciA family protein [Burkholderiaceae bacterium]
MQRNPFNPRHAPAPAYAPASAPALAAPGSRPLGHWIGSDPALRQLARQVDDLVALQRTLAQASGGAPIVVLGLADTVLSIQVPGPAWASRLRQSEPSLLAALAGGGFQVTRLRIRPIRRSAGPAAPAAAPKPTVPAAALGALASLHAGVEPSPLREALARMITRHGQAGGRSQAGDHGPSRDSAPSGPGGARFRR